MNRDFKPLLITRFHLKRRWPKGIFSSAFSSPLIVKVDSDFVKRDLPVVIFSNLICRLSGLVALARYFFFFSVSRVPRRLSIQKCSVGFFSVSFPPFHTKTMFLFSISYYRARFAIVSRGRDSQKSVETFVSRQSSCCFFRLDFIFSRQYRS